MDRSRPYESLNLPLCAGLNPTGPDFVGHRIHWLTCDADWGSKDHMKESVLAGEGEEVAEELLESSQVHVEGAHFDGSFLDCTAGHCGLDDCDEGRQIHCGKMEVQVVPAEAEEAVASSR